MKSISKILKKNKVYLLRALGFLILIFFIYLLSRFLTQITFLESLDINNPDHTFKEIPDVNLEQRKVGFFFLLGFFGIVSVVIGRWQGFASFLGLILSVFTIYSLIIPLILAGWSPPLVTFLSGLLVITGTIFFAHGFNSKTIVAITGSTLTLILTLILGEIFRILLQITGYASSETYYLLVNSQLDFDMARIVLASIILSGIGLLDDISVTQASIIHELSSAKPEIKLKELYTSAMNVGRDHAGAVVNSLFWVYAASTLPLLLLASFDGVTIASFLNNNIFMEEVLKTLVTSSGLVLAIPITTLIGAIIYKNPKAYKLISKYFPKGNSSHSHSH